MKKVQKYKLEKIKQKLTKPWSPLSVAYFDDHVLRVAIFNDEYHWHSHKNEDELFLVYEGSILIETDDGNIKLDEGEGVVIPKGLPHKPSAKKPSFVLMIEAKKLDSNGDKSQLQTKRR